MPVPCSYIITYREGKTGLQTEHRNHCAWKMKEILDNDGYSYIFLGMTENESEIIEGDIRSLSNKIKCKGKEIFAQKIFHHIQNKSEKGEGKLLFYAKLKQQFKQEKYLNLTNIKHRNAIRDIRMSTHKLQIETGGGGGTIRYLKEHRLCNGTQGCQPI